MKSILSKLPLAASVVLCLSTFALPCRAQTESKAFGKLLQGEDSITIKAHRTARVSGGVKTWKRDLEIIVYKPYDTEHYYSDEHYPDKDIASLHKVLLALTAKYQEWKGKHLGTQSDSIEVRIGNGAEISGISLALQMDEAGKISFAFLQADVGIETTPANLAKFTALTNNAIAWLASPSAAAGGKGKPAK